METRDPVERTKQALRVWAGIRIGYGVVAILAPRLMFRLLRMEPHPDARGFNAFLGSRDIVVGAVALRASTTEQVRAAVDLNHGNEIVDSVVLAQEIRQGRGADPFNVVGVVFNAIGHATWLTARARLRGR
ncbi:hypothetical protein SK069_16030 [Patulibacter brassicae]|jgi:hypothetical protein|uniref:DUF4267 domain-containing protein n=1 Tax=Patulibacter brassicae TaxID=1705717 RepID=A0ABU4VPX2_9ACTN|nr:hypothetical protein [Patulibacter brassicae]MDX8153109.1 hypothetical protein [Patulibacter brassicae]